MTTFFPTLARRDLKNPIAPVAQAQILQAHSHQFFSPEVQAELAKSDKEAWTAVCMILLTIVTLGLLIGIGAVLLTL